MKGRVNGVVFITPSGRTYPKETLKYDGYSCSSKINVTNATGENFPMPVWDVQHRFSFDQIGWNKILEDGEKKEVRDKNDKRFFKTSDLHLIFMGYGTGHPFAFTDLDYIQTRLDNIAALLEVEGSFPFSTPAYKQNIDEIAV